MIDVSKITVTLKEKDLKKLKTEEEKERAKEKTKKQEVIIQERAKIKKAAAQREVEKKEQQLLTLFASDSRSYSYVVQILETIKKNYTTSTLLTEKEKDYISTYGSHFNLKLYKEILPYCQLAYLYEDNGDPEDHALKLSLVFDNLKDILNYLDIQSKQNKKILKDEKDNDVDYLVYDACLFGLPDIHSYSIERWAKWKRLFNLNCDNAEFKKIFSKATEIEALINVHYSEDKNPQQVQKTSTHLIKAIEQKNQEVKRFASRASELYEEEFEKYKVAIKELSDLRLALFEQCKGLALKNMNFQYLMAFNEKYLIEHSGIYRYLLEKGLRKRDYDEFCKLKPIDDDEQIPNIKISGLELDPHDSSVYLMKVPVLDEFHAARAACLGKLTDCCQSLSGELGEPCVKHGIQSKYGGFYVICKGNIDNPSHEDFVLGQCWAWRSQTGAIVFDSIETVDKKDPTIDTVTQFFNLLAKKLTAGDKPPTHKVVCGASSGISKQVGFDASMNRTENFIDYNGYNDSTFQRVLIDKHAPFYFYDINETSKIETQQLANKEMEQSDSLIQSDYICQLLNFIALQNKFGLGVQLHEDILNIAKKHNKEKECRDILNAINLFANGYHSIKELKEILHFIQNKTLPLPTLNLNRDTFLLMLLKTLINRSPSQREAIKQIIFELIDSTEIDINQSDAHGRTPFTYAVRSGDRDLCRKLQEKGANVYAEDRRGQNVLINTYEYFIEQLQLHSHSTLSLDNQTILMTLISEFKLNINSKDKKGATLLMKEASSYAENSLIDELIKQGANVDEKNDYGDTALMIAIYCKSDNYSKFLKYADINIQNNDRQTALELALEKHFDEAAFNLIEKGAKIYNKDSNILLNLHALAKKVPAGPSQQKIKTAIGKLISELLASSEVDVNQVDEEGLTPFMLAAMNWDLALCRQLVAKGANVHIEDPNNENVLIKTLKKFNTSPELVATHQSILIQLITEFNLDINSKEQFGKPSPLELAIQAGLSDVCILLINRGARINQKTLTRQSLLTLAIILKLPEVAIALIKQGADVNEHRYEEEPPLILAIQLRLTNVCQSLIEHGAEVNQKPLNVLSYNAPSPLMLAAERGLIDVCIDLVKHGADVNYSNNLGNTPLIIAAKNGQNDICEFLIQSGAEVAARYRNDPTPLEKAMATDNFSLCLTLIKAYRTTPSHYYNSGNLTHQQISRFTTFLKENMLNRFSTNIQNEPLRQIISTETDLKKLLDLCVKHKILNTPNDVTELLLSLLKKKQFALFNHLLETTNLKENNCGYLLLKSAITLLHADTNTQSDNELYFKAIQDLIHNGATINSSIVADTMSPLIMACCYGNITLVRYLLEKNANPVYKLRHPALDKLNDALSIAQYLGYNDIINLLASSKRKSSDRSQAITPSFSSSASEAPSHLFTALRMANMEMAEKLINEGAKLHECSIIQLFHLMPNKEQFLKVADYLVNHLKLEADSLYGHDLILTLTHAYSVDEEKAQKLIDTLIEKGAKVEMYPSHSNQTEMLTPLMVAASQGNIKLIKLFLTRGANPDNFVKFKTMMNKPMKAIDFALNKKHDSAAELIKEYSTVSKPRRTS